MSEFLEMLTSLEIPHLVLCAIAVIILDLFALSVILSANRESKLCRKRWKHISADMSLCYKEHYYPLEADEILLGRHLSADIRFTDASVSRYHAVLTVTNGVWSITDLNARSGTFVNDRRVQHCRLRVGDDIRLGDTTISFCKLPAEEERKRGGKRA